MRGGSGNLGANAISNSKMSMSSSSLLEDTLELLSSYRITSKISENSFLYINMKVKEDKNGIFA